MTVRKLRLKWIRVVPLVALLGVLGLLLGTSLQSQPAGPVNLKSEQGQPLTPRGLENLVAFTRLLGYVRYFHPSDQAQPAVMSWESWGPFTVEGVQAVESVQDAPELARTLEKLFQPLAPTVRVFPVGQRPSLPEELNPPRNAQNLQVVMWYHRGLGTPDISPDIYRSERLFKDAPNDQVPPGMHDPRQPFYAELGGGVAALVPLGLFADEGRTLPIRPFPPRPPSAPSHLL